MARHRFRVSGLRVLPEGMFFALPALHTAVSAQMPQQPFQPHPILGYTQGHTNGLYRQRQSGCM